MAEYDPEDSKLDADLVAAEALIFKAQQRRREADPYDTIVVRWLLVSDAVKIHLLLH